MHIFLLVLKIIGFVLLGVLALILLLILEALFVPFCYRVKGNNKDANVWVKGRISWLFSLFRLNILFEDNKLSLKAYFLFFKVMDSDKKSSKAAKNVVKEEKTEEEHDESNNFKEIVDKIIKNKDLLLSDATKDTIYNMLESTKSLVKHILPRKIKGDIIYSLGSPDNTGYLLGIICMLYGIIPEGLNIDGDFDSDAYVSFDVSLKGHFFGIIFVIVALRTIKDKNIRKIIDTFKEA